MGSGADSVTTDFVLDRMQEIWPTLKKRSCSTINADNGQENTGVRT